MKKLDFKLAESVVPLVSPLTEEEEIDVALVSRLIRYQTDCGTNAIFVAGTCGEGPSLTDRAREHLLDATMEAAGKTPILVGAIETATNRAANWAHRAARAGVSAIVVMPPIFAFARAAAEYTAHTDRIAQAAGFPVILYNFPAQTGGQNIPIDAIRGMIKMGIVIGIKESGGNANYLRELLQVRAEFPGFRVMNGDLKLAGEAVLLQVDGLVMSYTNVDPRGSLEMIDAGRSGKASRVEQLQRKFNEVRQTFPEHAAAPSWTKAILAARGLCLPYCCSPTTPLAPCIPAPLEEQFHATASSRSDGIQ